MAMKKRMLRKTLELGSFRTIPYGRALLVTAALACAGAAHAQFIVDNLNNGGSGSLRRAINDVNNLGLSPSTITITTGGVVILQGSQLPALQKSVHINGPGALFFIVDGSFLNPSTAGLRFHQNTADGSSVEGITFRNFQDAGITINPSNNNESVEVVNCVFENCADGIRIGKGTDHLISNTSFEDATWGARFVTTNSNNVTINGCSVSGHTLGGVQFVSNNHTAENCVIFSNGSSEVSDHRGGVVFGSTSWSASDCTVQSSTVAGNTPYGVKRTSGSSACVISGNELYSNATQGIRVLGTKPTVTLWRFIIDTVNDQVILGGSATGPPNTSLDLEFFAALDDEGAAYFDTDDDLSVQLDGSGDASFFHKIDRDFVFLGVVAFPPGPHNFALTNSDSLTATATSATQGTSEFSQVATVTSPGDFDFDGFVTGTDLLIMQQNWGSQNAEYWEGDADFDGDVDGDDLEIWEQN